MKTEAYIKKIIEETGLTRKEIEEMVKEKKEELKGLISDEGALFVIAKEMGVDVKDENKDLLKDIEVNISDIIPNMKNITLIGRIREINRVHSFDKNDGEVGYVGSFLLHDNSGDIRIVLWDEHVKIFKDINFDLNELVKVLNGYAKKGRMNETEIHVGKMGKLILSPEDVDYRKYPKMKSEIIPLRDINLNMKSVSVEGRIMQIFPIKEFTRKDGSDGKVRSLTLVEASGSTIRITYWNEDTEKTRDLEIDNFISITNLNPRLSTLDSKTVELHANNYSALTKKAKKLKIKSDVVEKIENLQKMSGITSFQGVISSVDNMKTVSLKSGDDVLLLGFLISDDSDSIRVTLWRDKAEEFSEVLKVGIGISLKNVMVKYSNFSERNEISFIKDSSLEIIDLEIKNLKTQQGEVIEGEKIDDIILLQDKKGIVSFQGVVSSLDNIKKISLKNGDKVSLLGFNLSDETDGIRVTLWRDMADEFSEKLIHGQGVMLKNVMLKFNSFSNRNEVSLNKNSSLELIDLKINNIKEIKPQIRDRSTSFLGNYTKIDSIKSSGTFEIKGFVAKEISRIIIYEACSNCNKKIENCSCEVKGENVNRMIFNVIIDDGTSSIKAIFGREPAERLIGEETDILKILKETPDFDAFLEDKSNELLGKDIIIKGRSQFSDYSDSYEISVYDFTEVNISEELEKVMKEIEH